MAKTSDKHGAMEPYTNLEEMFRQINDLGVGETLTMTEDYIQNLNPDAVSALNKFLSMLSTPGYVGGVSFTLTTDARGYVFKREKREPTIYQGDPDARYQPEANPSIFRPRYRKLNDEELTLHDNIKSAATALETLFDKTPESRERSIAMTKLEEAVMWAVKGLTK